MTQRSECQKQRWRLYDYRIVDVGMKNAAYNSKSVEISVGATVRWKNMDTIYHGGRRVYFQIWYNVPRAKL